MYDNTGEGYDENEKKTDAGIAGSDGPLHISAVGKGRVGANKLYIGDKEAFARKMIETCINNEFRDVRFSYDMGYPAEITMDIYTNETARRLGIRCCEVRYAQPEKDRYRYNVKDDRERFVMTVK